VAYRTPASTKEDHTDIPKGDYIAAATVATSLDNYWEESP